MSKSRTRQSDASPCSVHDPEQAIAYAKKLYEYAVEAKDDLVIVMRVYFEKWVSRRWLLKAKLTAGHARRSAGRD